MLPRVALFVVASALRGVDGFGYMAPCMHADGHDCMNEAGCYWDGASCYEDACRSRPRARAAPSGAHTGSPTPTLSPQASPNTTKRCAMGLSTATLSACARGAARACTARQTCA